MSVKSGVVLCVILVQVLVLSPPLFAADVMMWLDPDNKVVWELRESDLPGIQLFCLMGVQRLPNGNTLICNGDFHIKELPRGEVMIFEVTREKEVVWKLTRSDIRKTLPPMMQGENPIYRTTQVSLIGKENVP